MTLTINIDKSKYGYLNRTQSDDQLSWKLFPYKKLYALLVLAPAILAFLCGLNLIGFIITGVILVFPIVVLSLFFISAVNNNNTAYDTSEYESVSKHVTFHDDALARKYQHTKIPFEELYEAYMNGKVDFEGDLLTALEARYAYSTMRFTLNHLRIFLANIVPEFLIHSRVQDQTQVRDHYERGNDFYRAFLGPSMVYTSGILHDPTSAVAETLEEMQQQKIELVAQKLNLKKDERLLDIGCGWGTWVIYAAEHVGAHATGVTLARDQVDHATVIIKEKSLEDKVRMLTMDYRDIPREKFDKISCLEMAEHVGVRNFGSFLKQVSDLLVDDGVFFLQIAGLRRAWQWEDFVWGLFMGKYVFPGADASCPLGWVINQLERAGFEVVNVDTIGVHYSATIQRWYENWMHSEEYIVQHYGKWWFRCWAIFLAWSTIIAREGRSTAYQIVCHKNLNGYARKKFMGTSRLNARSTNPNN
eukprot:GEMP01013274.1.p1 GENE.GEMP01013274.1~~GEMP01013274.1.p1  ORF type:complete len:474 (+),score=143.00 GEMP01013274.1:160-1581(+)